MFFLLLNFFSIFGHFLMLFKFLQAGGALLSGPKPHYLKSQNKDFFRLPKSFPTQKDQPNYNAIWGAPHHHRIGRNRKSSLLMVWYCFLLLFMLQLIAYSCSIRIIKTCMCVCGTLQNFQLLSGCLRPDLCTILPILSITNPYNYTQIKVIVLWLQSL